MCLYPYNQISPNSPYFEPAVNSLKLRGDEATGWSMGWKVNLWARALDGDHARKIIKNALKHSTSYSTDQYRGGIYYNLWDSHAPFQIDGNFGVCSGIAEMLMQSHTDTIQILPALASAWESGSITGLKAVGDFVVDIKWAAGQLTTAKIVSNQGQPLVINYKGLAGKKVSVNGEEVSYTIVDGNTIEVKATAGDTVEVDYNTISSHITTLTTLPKGGKVYTLDGREVHNPQGLTQGLYIADGKKVIIK
jgi:alpha-L-fucosidase 2